LPKTRTIFFCVILALGIANGLRALKWEWENRGEPDFVGAAERILAPLRREPGFPAEVSYAGDPDAFHRGDQAGFRLFQYSLAPVLVSDRIDQEWLIWNGPLPTAGEKTLQGYSFSRKLGGTLFLYRREKP